jgi:hypothetical protein
MDPEKFNTKEKGVFWYLTHPSFCPSLHFFVQNFMHAITPLPLMGLPDMTVRLFEQEGLMRFDYPLV